MALFKGRIFSNFNFKGNFFLNFFSSVRLAADFYNSVLTCFFCFRSYDLLLVFVISCCNGNFAVFARSYFFSLSGFKVFVVDILCVEGFFYNFCYWFCTDFYNSVGSFFSCLEFAFFSFSYLAILDNKCVCSFLFSRISFFNNFLLACIQVLIVFDYSLVIYIFLFSYFMSTVVGALTYLDDCIFCRNFCDSRFAVDFRIFDCPSCSLCADLTRFYNLVFAFFKCIYFFNLIFEWQFFFVFNLAFGVSTYFYNSLFRSLGFTKFACFSLCYIAIFNCKSNISLLFSGFAFLNFFGFTWSKTVVKLDFSFKSYFNFFFNLVSTVVYTFTDVDFSNLWCF